MELKATKCPACLRDIQIPTDTEDAACMYCGQKITNKITPTMLAGPSIANFLGLARTADLAGNYEEAESYYTRVLEYDPAVSEAWFGKGKSAGWQSSPAKIRLNETLTSFGHAIGTAAQGSKTAVATNCVEEINKIVSALYSVSRNHMLEHVALPNVWDEYVSQVAQMMQALVNTLDWKEAGSPASMNTLNNIVYLCKDNIEGVSYRDPYDDNSPKARHLSPEYENQLREFFAVATNAIKEHDSSYTPPSIEKKNADPCFVVTATMGDDNHPTVVAMREFRDQWLIHRGVGIALIRLYYNFGPVAARVIKESLLLRLTSFVFIVAPGSLIARLILKSAKK